MLKIPPVNLTVLEFEAAFFHCSVKNPEIMSVTWFKDGEILSNLKDLASRTVIGVDGSKFKYYHKRQKHLKPHVLIRSFDHTNIDDRFGCLRMPNQKCFR